MHNTCIFGGLIPMITVIIDRNKGTLSWVTISGWSLDIWNFWGRAGLIPVMIGALESDLVENILTLGELDQHTISMGTWSVITHLLRLHRWIKTCTRLSLKHAIHKETLMVGRQSFWTGSGVWSHYNGEMLWNLTCRIFSLDMLDIIRRHRHGYIIRGLRHVGYFELV